MPTLLHALRSAALVGVLVPFAATACAQVTPIPPLAPLAPLPPEPPPARSVFFSGTGFAARTYLGITPRYSSGSADTLGVLVDDVESGYAADKAGIRRGSRLVSIDDVDLRVDPRDLGDYAGELLPQSRLRRVLGRKSPGDTVSVVVLTDGRKETRRVELGESPFAASMRAITTDRRVLGVSFSERGSMRDTAGLLIVTVTSGGAADKAGLNEGDRIVSIDGIDLRVPASDAGTSEGVSARVSRFRRALDAARDSQAVKLDVLSDGRHRTVSIVPTRERGYTFTTAGLGDLATNIRASVGRSLSRDLDWSSERGEAARERSQERAEELRERAQEQREMQREQREMAREMRESMRDRFGSWSDDGDTRVRGTIRGRTDGATISLSGLSLAVVDSDFAQQFGRGSESGALIVRIRGDWDPLKAGDVLLTVDGRSVRDGNGLDVSFDRRRDLRLEVLRNGKKEILTLPATR